ncbi:MAG: HAMP domain-containing sensor histidine kinase [Bacteroidota bacterium]
MRYLTTIIVAISCLIGLMFIQYRLLRTGLVLEKARFDQKLELSLHQVVRTFAQPSIFQERLLLWYTRPPDSLHLLEQTLPQQLEKKIAIALQTELQAQDISTQFSFALIEEPAQHILLASPSFQEEAFSFQTYRRAISGPIIRACGCELLLQVHFDHLFSFLLAQMAYLIVPSIIFFIALVICVGILVNSLLRQRKRDQVKNDFINNLTHELKTPVFSVQLMIRLLRDAIQKRNEAKSKELLHLLQQENTKLSGHIEKVLELASLEQKNYQLERTPLDMHQLIEEVSKSFEVRISAKAGQLKRQLAAALPMVSGDKTHLANVCRNVLDNALKYSAGAPTITVSTANIDHYFSCRISDNGIGIPKAFQGMIFQKFYRVPNDNIHNNKGFGLGLSYVKQVVEAHGGQVVVQSQVGKGSQFEIRLPYLNS